jgi:hypothetical protein
LMDSAIGVYLGSQLPLQPSENKVAEA